MLKRRHGKENTEFVQVEFENLFQYTGKMLLKEIASIFLSLFLLIFVVPQVQWLGNILEFIEEYTVDVENIGHVCMYCFKGFITDDSATISLTYFSPTAKNIIVTECSKILQQLESKDPYRFPTLITALEGQQYIFQFHINPSSKSGQVDFIFDNIINQTPAAITLASDKALAIMKNLAEESSRSSTTTLEKMSDIPTPTVVFELHLAEKSSLSSKPNTSSTKNAL
ncbi:autophagy-related protein 9 [Tanacetum coccineum]